MNDIDHLIKEKERAIKENGSSLLKCRLGLLWSIGMFVNFYYHKEIYIYGFIPLALCFIALALCFLYGVYRCHKLMFVLKSTLDDLRAMK